MVIIRELCQNKFSKIHHTFNPPLKAGSPTVASSILNNDDPLSYVIELNALLISAGVVTSTDTGLDVWKPSSYITGT